MRDSKVKSVKMVFCRKWRVSLLFLPLLLARCSLFGDGIKCELYDPAPYTPHIEINFKDLSLEEKPLIQFKNLKEKSFIKQSWVNQWEAECFKEESSYFCNTHLKNEPKSHHLLEVTIQLKNEKTVTRKVELLEKCGFYRIQNITVEKGNFK